VKYREDFVKFYKDFTSAKLFVRTFVNFFRTKRA